MSLEIDDYQKSLEALQTKLLEKEKELADSQEEVSRTEKRTEDIKAQIGKIRNDGFEPRTTTGSEGLSVGAITCISQCLLLRKELQCSIKETSGCHPWLRNVFA